MMSLLSTSSRFKTTLLQAGSLFALCIAAPAALAQSATSDGLGLLAQFIKNTRGGSTHFTQTVTQPVSKNANLPKAKSKVSSGNFSFARPKRFRFDYQKPYAQSIIADGKTLWFYDPDLQQATAHNQDAALQSTPAALIASAESLEQLRAQFTLTALTAAQAPQQISGLQWVQAKPKIAGGTLQYLRAGFATGKNGVELRALQIVDSFGQTSFLQFEQTGSGQVPAAASFSFKPPAGVAVIRQ